MRPPLWLPARAIPLEHDLRRAETARAGRARQRHPHDAVVVGGTVVGVEPRVTPVVPEREPVQAGLAPGTTPGTMPPPGVRPSG